MSIYITGDVHRLHDFDKLEIITFGTTNSYPKKEDYLIICGDWGAIWFGDERDQSVLEWYISQPWTTVIVLGNHENYDTIEKIPIEEWHGGYVRKIANNVIIVERGEIIDIEGNSFFMMGGADSIDKSMRIPHVSWWAQEMPSKEEIDRAWKNLCDHDLKVDYIITHCAPSYIVEELYTYKSSDSLTDFLRSVSCNVEYKMWFCGHYHQDICLHNNFYVCYNFVRKIEDNKTKIIYKPY